MSESKTRKREIAQREAAEVCIDCGGPLDSGTIVGAGDGTGRKFVDHHCWLRRRMVEMGVKPTGFIGPGPWTPDVRRAALEYDLLAALNEIERLRRSGAR